MTKAKDTTNAGAGAMFSAEPEEEFAAFDALHPLIRRYMTISCPRKISALQLTQELNKSRLLSALTPEALVKRLHYTVLNGMRRGD